MRPLAALRSRVPGPELPTRAREKAGGLASDADVALVKHQLGLDQDSWHRYLDFRSKLLTHGSRGRSYYSERLVWQDVWQFVPSPLGLLASQKSRWAERFMRGLDMFQAFPLLVLAIVVVAIALIYTPRFIRLVRSEALSLRESRFVEAAVAIGATRARVMFRQLLPNTTGTLLVQASLTAAQSIVVSAALAYLGIGIRPPQASRAAMIKDGYQGITTGQWWIAIFPGIAVFVCVLLFNQIADRLEKLLSRGARGY